MKAEWRRPAIIGALAAAALAVAPAAALASSSVTYLSGVVTVNGDGANNHFDVTFGTSGAYRTIDFHDLNLDPVNTPGGVCQADGSQGVICTADATNSLDRVVINGGDGENEVTPHSPPAGFPLTFNGGADYDQLDAGPEQDTFNGGPGYDQADYENMAGPVTVSADGVANDGEAGESDNIGTDVEEIVGTDQNDTLTATNSVLPRCTSDCAELFGLGGNDTLNGGSGPDYIDAGPGNDTVNGNAGDDQIDDRDGNDVLNGGAGQDEFYGGSGADDIHGGPDFDQVDYYNEPWIGSGTPSVNVSLDDVANDGMTGQDGAGTDGAGPAADDVHSDVEAVNGSDGNDTLTGSPGVNDLYGGNGNDTIDGLGGPDVLVGGIGDDIFLARDNAPDIVECDAGNDTVTSDDIDTVSDCETNNVAKATLPVQIVTQPGVPKPRLNPAKVKLGSVRRSVKRKSFLKHGVTFTLSANEAVAYSAELTGTYHGAHVSKVGDVILAARSLRSSGRKVKVTLKLNRHTRRAIGRKANLKLTVIATNSDGNISKVSRRIRVK